MFEGIEGYPNKIIFLDENGTIRAPIAAIIARSFLEKEPVEVVARGLVVHFPEPMNQKAEAVLISNGHSVEGYVAKEICASDFTEGAVCFVMESKQRRQLLDRFEELAHGRVKVLSTFVEQELEIMNPYGAPVQTYGLCYESLEETIKKAINRIWGN